VRFNAKWSLSPEQSLFIHTGNWAVPRQLLVRSPRARNKVTALAHDTSLLEVRVPLPSEGRVVIVDGLRLFSLPAALVAVGPGLFTRNVTEARTALAMVHDASDVLTILLSGGHSVVAGRLAGAFRNIGRNADSYRGARGQATRRTRRLLEHRVERWPAVAEKARVRSRQAIDRHAGHARGCDEARVAACPTGHGGRACLERGAAL